MRGLSFLLVVGAIAAPRRILAWTHQKEEEAAQQLRDNPGLFDGIYVGYCGVHINTTVPTKPFLYVTDYYNAPRCRAVTDAAKELGLELHMWLDMENSAKTFITGREAEVDVSALVETTVAAAKKYGWAGVNYDDESQTCPRRDASHFANWVGAVDAWARGVNAHGVQLTADVQSLSCTVCSPWPACLDDADANYTEQYQATENLLANTSVNRWVEMDTYYGNLGFFYDNLDFYAKRVPRDRLGVGIMPNANPTNHDQTIARFHSIELLEVAEVDVFKLPLNPKMAEEYLPALMKWKYRCNTCHLNGQIGCWERCGVKRETASVSKKIASAHGPLRRFHDAMPKSALLSRRDPGLAHGPLLPSGPNARTDGEMRAVWAAEHARDVAESVLPKVEDLDGRVQRAAMARRSALSPTTVAPIDFGAGRLSGQDALHVAEAVAATAPKVAESLKAQVADLSTAVADAAHVAAEAATHNVAAKVGAWYGIVAPTAAPC